MSRKQKIVFSISGIVIVLLILLGLTFGYYLTNINGNENERSVTVSLANLELTYDDGNGTIIAEKIIPGQNIDTKTFTIENTGNAKVIDYTVYLEDVMNTFTNKDDVVLTLTCTSSDGSNCNGTEISYPSSETLLVVNDIDVDVIHSYELKVDFLETGVDQSVDMNKTLKGNVIIKDLKSTGKTSSTLAGTNNIVIDDTMLLKNYRIYGNSIQGKVPAEYQQVEYIESTGTQYIEIDFIANQDTKALTKYQIVDDTKSGMLFGSRTSFTDNYYGFSWGGSTPWLYYNAYNSGTLTDETIDTEIHTAYKDKGTLYIDDKLINTQTSTTNFTTPNNMIIFGCNTNGTIGSYSSARIYSLQFYNNDNLEVDLVPVYRKTDNVLGLYDLVNDVFYTNAGTGVFLKGNNAPTPESPLEIQSVGDYDEESGKYKIPITTSGKNLLNSRLWETSKTQYGLTIYYNEEEDCFVLNGTATKKLPYYQVFFNLPVEKNSYFSLSSKYISGEVTRPNSTDYAIAYFGTNDNPGQNINWKTLNLQNYDSLTENVLCTNNYITSMWFYISENVSFNNYKIKIQLENGSAVTEYEPYVEPITTNILLDEPLRKIGDCETCSDYIDFNGSNVVRNISQVILNGNENWSYFAGTGIYQFYKTFDNILHDNSLITTMSSHYRGWFINNRTNNYNTLYTYSGGLGINDNRYTTIDAYNTWLKSNNVTVLHRNATPVVNNLDLSGILLQDGINIINVNTTVLPSNIDIDVIK